MIGIERTERDVSQVIVPVGGETFGMVLRVPYGPLVPTRIITEEDLLDYFSTDGKPDPDYTDYHEAIVMLKQTPILACRPQGDALFGGVLVEDTNTGNSVEPLVTGISDPDNYTFVSTNQQFAIIGADPSADNNNYSVTVVESTTAVDNSFDINLYYNDVLVQNFNVSLLRTQLDGFGNSIYIEEIISGRSDIQVIVNSNADLTLLPHYTSSAVTFGGGVNITDFSDTADTIAAWNYFSEFNKYYTHYLVDTSANATIGKAVEDIAVANWYQFVYAAAPSIKSSNPRSTETLNTWYNSVADYRDVNGTDLNLNSDHIALYANWARISDNYNNTIVWVSPASLAASRKAFVLNNISISQAACGAADNRGAVSEVIELEQDPTSLLDTLDAIQVNTITYSPAGPVVWGEKTMQVKYSNTSFISHRTYFFYLEENIEQALFFYVFTDINTDTRNAVKALIENFTNPEIGTNAEDIQVRVPEDAALAAQRKMKVQVACIPYPKANKILFEFISARTGVQLSEVF